MHVGDHGAADDAVQVQNPSDQTRQVVCLPWGDKPNQSHLR